MSTFEERQDALARWKAEQAREPNIFDVLKTGNPLLIEAFIEVGFRMAAARAIAETRRVEKIRSAALVAYGGDADKAEQFLRRKHRMLDDKTPLEKAVESDEGVRAVIQLLNREEDRSG